MSSYTRQQLESYLKTIDVKCERCLDIGGSQNPTKGRTKSWDVKDYKILDLEKPHEKKKAPDIILDIQERDLYGSIDYREWLKYFDVAFCMEVSEYWYRPYNALRNITYFLKPGGILYISFHFIYKMHAPYGLDYLRYTPFGAKKLLEENGLEIIEEVNRLANSDLLTMYYECDKMRGIKDNNVNHNVIGSLIKAKKM